VKLVHWNETKRVRAGCGSDPSLHKRTPRRFIFEPAYRTFVPR